MINAFISILIAIMFFYFGLDSRRSKSENELTDHDLISAYEFEYQQLWWVFILVGVIILIIGISHLINLS